MNDSLIPASNHHGCLQHDDMECNEFSIENNSINTTEQNQQIEHKHYEPLLNDCKENINEPKHIKNEESTTVIKEIKIMCNLAIPVCITSICRVAMWNTDQIFLGHLGTNQLAGAALADVCMEILTLFVYSPAWSLNGLCSQALGSGNKKMTGYWLQLCIIICTIITLPVYIGYFFVGDLISLVSSDESVIHFTKLFAHYSSLFLWTSAMMFCIRLFHQSLEIVNPFTMISIFAIATNILGNKLWIYGLNLNVFNLFKIEFDGLGFIGSPLATSTSMLLQLFLYYIWCFVIKKYHIKHNTWNGWSLKQTICHLKRCKEFLKVVIPNAFGDASENWAYQVIILYAATLQAAEIAALSCMFAVWGILWSFYSGIGMSIITRVGKKIGAVNIEDAKMVTKIGLLLGLIASSFISLSVFLARDYISMIYSGDKEVHHIMRECIPYLCMMYIIGSCGWCAINVLEAMSKNKYKAFICVSTAWFGYVPLSIFFMHNNNLLNVSPVTCIFMVGLLVETVRTLLLWFTVIKVDWKQCCIEAQTRNELYQNMMDNGDDNDKNQNDSIQNKVTFDTELNPALLDVKKDAATAV